MILLYILSGIYCKMTVLIFGGILFYLINTTAALAILTSVSYFYAGISKKGLLILISSILCFIIIFSL